MEEDSFKIGDYAKLITHISDGYNAYGDYNVIFPPPTIVKVVQVDNSKHQKYGVKVIKEVDLPKELQGKQFRAKFQKRASGPLFAVENKANWMSSDDRIDQKYWDEIYWQPEYYLEHII